jgi:hypothetical protein
MGNNYENTQNTTMKHCKGKKAKSRYKDIRNEEKKTKLCGFSN